MRSSRCRQFMQDLEMYGGEEQDGKSAAKRHKTNLKRHKSIHPPHPPDWPFLFRHPKDHWTPELEGFDPAERRGLDLKTFTESSGSLGSTLRTSKRTRCTNPSTKTALGRSRIRDPKRRGQRRRVDGIPPRWTRSVWATIESSSAMQG